MAAALQTNTARTIAVSAVLASTELAPVASGAARGGAIAAQVGTGFTSRVAEAANNVAVRQHYLKTLEGIPGKIAGSLPIRDQALQAFQLRNAAKVEARAMMTDRNAAALLNKTDPIPTLQDVVRKVYDGGRGPVGDDMWRAILESSTRSRASVNQALGVGN